jgi:hypothetical protein
VFGPNKRLNIFIEHDLLVCQCVYYFSIIVEVQVRIHYHKHFDGNLDNFILWPGPLQTALCRGGQRFTTLDGGGGAEQRATEEGSGAVFGCDARNSLIFV